jgi:hypothetical protein
MACKEYPKIKAHYPEKNEKQNGSDDEYAPSAFL